MTRLTHWSDRLRELAICSYAITWAATQESPLAAWRACERGDWLLWIAATLGVDRRLVVRAACKCARLALPHVPSSEDRPLKAIEAAERWADGLATIEEVRQAADAAADAASAVFYTTAIPVFYAAASAFYAADAARATDAVYSAAAAADRASCAADPAYDTVLSECADIVRSIISEDVMLAAWQDKEESP